MKVLMVCLGNICRSPLAEGILLHKIQELGLDWEVDSAGTSGWHAGELPDQRSIEIARTHDIDITRQRSRKLRAEDMEAFDLILAMDATNYQNILKLAKNEEQRQKVRLILNYAYPGENRQVPDPYYDGGFELVFQQLDAACQKIVEEHG